MIGFALPWILGVAVAGVLAISVLHLLSVRRPPELLLPTARFLPAREVRAVSRTRRPSDVLLLLVRVAVLLTAGVAAALPAWHSRARERAIVVVADGGVSRDTTSMRALLRDAGNPSRVVFVRAGDRVNADRARDAAALIPMAWQAASQLAQQHAAIDSIDLHLLLSDAPARDAGLAAWREAWPGRVTTHHPPIESIARRVVLVDVGHALARPGSSGSQRPVVNDGAGTTGAADDAVRAAFTWHAARVSRGDAERTDTVVLVRGDAESDAEVARPSSGAVVYWPLDGVPANWRANSSTSAGNRADSAAALAVAGRALIGPFPVTALEPENATAGATTDTSITPIAWWTDGRVAATERHTAGRCERNVAVVSDPASDMLLSVSANALFDRLLAPCATRAPVDASALQVTEGKDGALADAEQFRNAAGPHPARASWIVPLLFALSLVLLVVEWRLRTRGPVGAT